MIKKTKKTITKVLLVIGGAVLSLLLLAIVAVVLFLVTLPKDIAPFDDSHLRLAAPEPLSDELNAGTHYVKLYDYDQGGFEDRAFLRNMMAGAHDWDESKLSAMCEEFGYFKIIENIRKGNQYERCLLPDGLDSGDGYGLASDLFYDLFQCRVEYSIRSGEINDALSEVRAILEMWAIIQCNGLELSPFCYGRRAREEGLPAARKLARCGKVDTAGLYELQNIIKESPRSDEVSVAFWKRLYGSSTEWVDYMYAGDYDGYSSADEPIPVTLLQKIARRTFIHPNRCKKFYADLYSIYIEQEDHCFSEIDWGGLQDEIDLMESQLALKGLARFRVPNALGLTDCLSAAKHNLFIKKYQRKAEMKITAIIIALHCYKLQYGSFPPDLDSLVPEFLDTVPPDPFDGQPMRYNAEKGLVYSVGEDLKDSGGSAAQRSGASPFYASRENAEDFVFGLAWAIVFE